MYTTVCSENNGFDLANNGSHNWGNQINKVIEVLNQHTLYN